MPKEIVITAANKYGIEPGRGVILDTEADDLIAMGLAYEVEFTPLPSPKEAEPTKVIHEHITVDAPKSKGSKAK